MEWLPLSMVVFLQQKYLLLPFKSLTCIYGVAAPVCGGIPTKEIVYMEWLPLSMVVFLQQKYLLLPFKSLTCIYGVAAPVCGGIPTKEIFVIVI